MRRRVQVCSEPARPRDRQRDRTRRTSNEINAERPPQIAIACMRAWRTPRGRPRCQPHSGQMDCDSCIAWRQRPHSCACVARQNNATHAIARNDATSEMAGTSMSSTVQTGCTIDICTRHEPARIVLGSSTSAESPIAMRKPDRFRRSRSAQSTSSSAAASPSAIQSRGPCGEKPASPSLT
jgi:hypothetical protein